MVNWDDAKKAQLISMIFSMFDIHPSEAQKVELAAGIGSGCTPKAIAHQVTALRKGGATSTASSATLGGYITAAGTPKNSADPKKSLPRRTKKNGITDFGDEGEDNGFLAARPPAGASKRKFGEPAMEFADKIDTPKRERSFELNFSSDQDIIVGEEVGQGLRAKKAKYDNDL